MNINTYLAKSYPFPPCWALVADVYASELAQGVTDYKTINTSIRSIASAFRLALHKTPTGFAQIGEPVDFAVVLMGRAPALGLHHCGIYFGGKVLHALDSAPVYQDMTTLRDTYRLMEFWSKPA
jgi:hypothetical protein